MNIIAIDNEYYQISDEKIELGDWMYNPYNNTINYAVGDKYWFSAGFYKVIASTRNLPGIQLLNIKPKIKP